MVRERFAPNRTRLLLMCCPSRSLSASHTSSTLDLSILPACPAGISPPFLPPPLSALSQVKFVLDSESQDPLDVQMYQLKETHALVEEFMLLANITVRRTETHRVPHSTHTTPGYDPT